LGKRGEGEFDSLTHPALVLSKSRVLGIAFQFAI